MLKNDNSGVCDWECDFKVSLVFSGQHRRADLTFEEFSIPIDHKSFEDEAMEIVSVHFLVMKQCTQENRQDSIAIALLVPLAFGGVVAETLHPGPEGVGWVIIAWNLLDFDVGEPGCRCGHDQWHHIQCQVEVCSCGSPRIYVIDMRAPYSYHRSRR